MKAWMKWLLLGLFLTLLGVIQFIPDGTATGPATGPGSESLQNEAEAAQ